MVAIGVLSRESQGHSRTGAPWGKRCQGTISAYAIILCHHPFNYASFPRMATLRAAAPGERDCSGLEYPTVRVKPACRNCC